jgi:hypothetical protein
MPQFSNNRQRINKIFEEIKKNNSVLSNNKSVSNVLKKNNSKVKSPFVHYDSGWVFVEPVTSNSYRTTQKDGVVPTIIYLDETDFNIPEIDLPEAMMAYLEPKVLIKGKPNATMIAQGTANVSTWGNDYYSVYGDGNLIYKGEVTSVGEYFSQTEYDSGNIAIGNTKKVYRMVLEYTSGGQYYRLSGNVARIRFFDDLGTGYDGLDQDEWRISVDPNFPNIVDNEHRFLEMSDTEVEFIGDKHEVRYTTNPSPPPNYNTSTTVYENVQTSKKFSDVDFYIIKFGTQVNKYELDAPGGSIIATLPVAGGVEINSDDVTVTDISVSFMGYNLYYDSDTRWLFGIETTATPEGNGYETQLDNLPELSNPYHVGHTLPYTSIEFNRNPDDYPVKIEGTSFVAGEKAQAWFKKSKSTDNLNIYKYRFNIECYALEFATKEYSSENYNVYADVYTQSGSPLSYELTTENHSFKEKKEYVANGEDIEARFILASKNPHNYKELKKYDEI